LTQNNLDPILDKLFDDNNEKRPNWRTVVRWRKKYIDSNGDLASLIERHKMGNRHKRKSGDEPYFDQALEQFLDAKRPTVATAYEYYKNLILIENKNIVDGQLPIISYIAFNKRIKVLPAYPIAIARHGKFKADQWFAYYGAQTPKEDFRACRNRPHST
jgi:putative transposase